MKYRVTVCHDTASTPKAYYTSLTYNADSVRAAAEKARAYIARGGAYCDSCISELLKQPIVYRVKAVGAAPEIVRL